jgi:hypothetical protein
MHINPAAPTEAERLAIGQFLALAASANVYFDLVGQRVVIRAVRPNWLAWSALRHYLDEIGLARLEAYFHETSPAQRLDYAAAAQNPWPAPLAGALLN